MKGVKNIQPFGLRMQADIKELLRAQAENNGRSLHSEIMMRLKRSLQQDEGGQNESRTQ